MMYVGGMRWQAGPGPQAAQVTAVGGDRGGGAVAEASVAGACGRRLKPGVTSNRRKRRKRQGGGKLFFHAVVTHVALLAAPR